jgi:hypothetical protein
LSTLQVTLPTRKSTSSFLIDRSEGITHVRADGNLKIDKFFDEARRLLDDAELKLFLMELTKM